MKSGQRYGKWLLIAILALFFCVAPWKKITKKTVHQTTGKGAMAEALPDAADTSAAFSTLSKDAGKLEALDVSKMDHAGVNPISD